MWMLTLIFSVNVDSISSVITPTKGSQIIQGTTGARKKHVTFGINEVFEIPRVCKWRLPAELTPISGMGISEYERNIRLAGESPYTTQQEAIEWLKKSIGAYKQAASSILESRSNNRELPKERDAKDKFERRSKKLTRHLFQTWLEKHNPDVNDEFCSILDKLRGPLDRRDESDPLSSLVEQKVKLSRDLSGLLIRSPVTVKTVVRGLPLINSTNTDENGMTNGMTDDDFKWYRPYLYQPPESKQ